ncbi:hypothetical protein GCM10009678_06670 [Actinomadura kijaniata]|uniref:Uncharacterized protein n=1 Tax=Actinomadura namibiensis TaxID=182080 RepID=A0A7W3QKX1_ACTNM|nr:hypothetical protein [Actinomadura namibiensis]MBA8950368.1 hypothetical protein [Actinomadura namibiensis]
MSARPSWFFGTGTTAAEYALPCAAAVAGIAGLLASARGLDWEWWRHLVAIALVVDLAGGVVANGLDAAKRFYHGPLPLPPTRLNRFLHDPVGFTAVHLQPIVAGLVFGGPWWWGPLWYAWALAGVVLVVRAPSYLARPVALLVVLAGVMASTSLPDPAGFGWLPAVLLLKLVLAHAVPEQPYERAPEGGGVRQGT